jgi:imidazolonepropionase-like amidohydrolase
MKKNLLYLFLLLQSVRLTAQTTFPTNGVADVRDGYFAFTNATVFSDYQTKIDKATLIIRNGVVEAVGAGLAVPKGATEVNLNGKFIYPSLIDIYSDYGMPEIKRATFNFGREQFETEKKGAFGWNQAVKAEINAEEVFLVNDKSAKDLRKVGFGTVLSHHPDGLIRGTGALLALHTGKANEVMLSGRASTHFSLDKGSSTQNYPSSPMGFIALIRQTYLDADWYARSTDRKEYNLSLEAFNKAKNLPAIFEARNRLAALRIDKMGDEFGVNYILKGVGDEYQRINELKATNCAFIIPVNFPEAFEVADPLEATLVSFEDMKHWELAPTNPAAIAKAGITFALTAQGMKNKGDFLKNIQKAIEYGLPETDALKAITFAPAQMLKAEGKVGSLKKGMSANFLITSGNLFDKETVLYDNWVQGNRYLINQMPLSDVRGVYDLTMSHQSGTFKLIINGKAESPAYNLEKTADSLKISPKATRQEDLLTLAFSLAKKNEKAGETRLSGWLGAKMMKGTGEAPDGQKFTWQAVWKSEMPADTARKDQPKKETKNALADLGKVNYPFEAFGNEAIPQTETVLFKNATVWTNEKEGVLPETDVLVKNGKIAQIGKNIPTQGAKVIDATGKHLSTGVIDEHSHMALFSINDVQTVSSEVRMADVVNSEDIDIYRQLAGGVTAAQLLHGSANCIGGQSAIVKLKWGESPDKMLVSNAPGFIKFALGENVKNGNSGNNNTQRYPQTRMGVEQAMEDAFIRAKEYQKAKAVGGTNFRKDLELEAIVEILEGKRHITCHSYVQSEINMLMKLADKMGFKVNTFTHILEGYKVADLMKKHGAGGSSFSDWWAYKFEVKDAIPHNPAILAQVGVTTAINSDDGEMARRLNQEAAKAVKYGGVSEEEAWKMVTLNPAKLLHLDDRMGSIKAGKDADLVLWTDNPLSIYAVVEKTMVDGTVYFDREKDTQKQAELRKERARLIQKMIASKQGGEPSQKPAFRKSRRWACCEDLGDVYGY